MVQRIILFLLLMNINPSFGVLITSEDQLSTMQQERTSKIQQLAKKMDLAIVGSVFNVLPASAVVVNLGDTSLFGNNLYSLLPAGLVVGSAILPALATTMVSSWLKGRTTDQVFGVWEQLEQATNSERFIAVSKQDSDELTTFTDQESLFKLSSELHKRYQAWHAYKLRGCSNAEYPRWYKQCFDSLPVALPGKRIIPSEVKTLILYHAGMPMPSKIKNLDILQEKPLLNVLPFINNDILTNKFSAPLAQVIKNYRRLYRLCEVDAINFVPGENYTQQPYSPQCVKKDGSGIAQMYAADYGPPFYLKTKNVQELQEFETHYDWRKHNTLNISSSELKEIVIHKAKID